MSTFLSCRFCRKSLNEVFNFGYHPLANSLAKADQLFQRTYPLILYNCEHCGLAQVPDLKVKVFSHNYPYYSSVNKPYVDQCAKWAKSIDLKKDAPIMEIACNDGYLLKSLRELGYTNLSGVEPVARLATEARKYARVSSQFFNKTWAEYPIKQDLIICNNVLAHVPSINGFLAGIKGLLSAHGILSIEVPDLEKLVSGVQYDTIYHEHYSYFSKFSLTLILSEHGFEIKKIEEIPSHGGSLRVTAGHGTSPFASRSIEWGRFVDAFYRSKSQVLQKLHELQGIKKAVAAFGAAAKGISFINYLGIKSDLIKFCIDETPFKQGKFLPGSGIPIHGMDYLESNPPDYLFILPWNFADSIIDKVRAAGFKGKFLYRHGESLTCTT